MPLFKNFIAESSMCHFLVDPAFKILSLNINTLLLASIFFMQYRLGFSIDYYNKEVNFYEFKHDL